MNQNVYSSSFYSQAGGFEAPNGSQGGLNSNFNNSLNGKRREQNVRPVTLKQLTNAQQAHPEAGFTVDGVELSLITVIARVTAVTEVVTHITLKIHDHTSGAEVRMYQPQDGMDVATRRVGLAAAEGAWVRFVGLLKTFSGRRHLVAHSIVPVNDYNEIIMHLYQVMASHLFVAKGPSFSKSLQDQSQGNWNSKPQFNVEYSNYRNKSDYANYEYRQGYSAAQSVYGPIQQDLGHPLYNAISKVLTRPDLVEMEGVNRQFLLSEINRAVNGKRVSDFELNNALEWMLNEGHVYNTIDEDTFKSTN